MVDISCITICPLSASKIGNIHRLFTFAVVVLGSAFLNSPLYFVMNKGQSWAHLDVAATVAKFRQATRLHSLCNPCNNWLLLLLGCIVMKIDFF